MFTVCSKCNLRLTVTATDLRAAQGYVRCGRCHNVFNALAALADEPTHQADVTTAADTQGRPSLEPPAADAGSTDTSLEFNPASTNINDVFIEAVAGERTGTFESIILAGEDLAAATDADPAIAAPAPDSPVSTDPGVGVDVPEAADSPVSTDAVEAAPAVTVAEAESSQTADTASPTPAQPPAGPVAEPQAEVPAMRTAPDVAASAADLLGAQRSSARVPRWALQGVSGALTLCLLVQLIHHYRGELADTSLLRHPLNAIYQALGQPLEPHWDIGSYEIRQLGATTDGAAAGDLVVRASISNRATRDQPLPLLRVVMQDRFGNRVAGRDLKPVEYLGRGAPQVSLLAPGQRVDVQVAFQDPGQAATGFEIDACMPGHEHTMTCANDPGSH